MVTSPSVVRIKCMVGAHSLVGYDIAQDSTTADVEARGLLRREFWTQVEGQRCGRHRLCRHHRHLHLLSRRRVEASQLDGFRHSPRGIRSRSFL